MPAAAAAYQSLAPLQLDLNRFFNNVRSAKKGTAGGPSGTKAQHLKPLLENEQSMSLLGFAAARLAAAHIPAQVAAAIALCRMTALLKDNGRVRGIATGDVMRRLVTRTLAQQFASQLAEATAPFQFALSTRAGTDCAALLLRSILDLDPEAVVVSIEGIGAYDHVSRAAIFEQLLAHDHLRDLVPFVRMWYGQQSTHLWQDEAGQV